VRKRLDAGAVDREVGIEQVGKTNTLRFRCNTERLTIPVETECAAGLNQLQARLRIAEEQNLGRPVGASVDEVQSIRTDPLDTHDLDDRRACYPAYLHPRNDLFQSQQESRSSVGAQSSRIILSKRSAKGPISALPITTE
jgi:hypothetical protein